VHQAEKLSLEEIGRFVEASEGLRFESEGREQVYGWIERVLCQQEYAGQGKAARGLLRRYIEKITGMSRAQVTRLIARYTASGRVAARSYQRHRFSSRYTRADVELLAEVDEAHGTLSGQATRRILEREFGFFGKAEFERLARISNGHLYNLRKSSRYRERLRSYNKTRPRWLRLASGASPIPRASPVFCAWIRCIRATGRKPRASTTSTPSMRSRNGRWSWPRRVSRRPTWSLCWKPCCASFPFVSRAFTPTTAVNSSTKQWRSCSTATD
jgi:transposase